MNSSMVYIPCSQFFFEATELDAFLSDPDVINFFSLFMVNMLITFLIYLNCILVLASNLINYGERLWVQALPLSLIGNMSACKLTVILSHSTAFGIWASTPLDNIIMNTANN